MPQTDFYFVETRAGEQRHLLCLLVECLYERGKRILVSAESTMAARHLDQLLWAFSQESFVPHRILASGITTSVSEPVIIVTGEKAQEGYDVLVCDGTTVNLEFMKHFSFVFHFVLMDDPERRQESRLLWQAARDRGFELHHISYLSPVKISSVLEKLNI